MTLIELDLDHCRYHIERRAILSYRYLTLLEQSRVMLWIYDSWSSSSLPALLWLIPVSLSAWTYLIMLAKS